jgi:Zn-dependent peptidase ImmA (M78 family)
MAKSEAAARDLLDRHSISQPPVPVEKLAAAAGLTIVQQKMDSDVSGMLLRSDDSDAAVVGVNNIHSPTRRRFTIAHELGHYLLHEGRPVIVDPNVRANYRDSRSSLATDREEIEANQFAAELLMPAHMLRRALQGVDGHDDGNFAQTLAHQFKVSVEAMTYRLINLGLATFVH